MGRETKSKAATIALCDQEIAREFDDLRSDKKHDKSWHWERIDRWLDVRIVLMRKGRSS